MSPPSAKVNRRQFLRGAATATVGAAAAAGFYTWRVEPHWIEVVDCLMPLRGLPPALEGKRVVQISDTHVSQWVPGDYLRHAMGLVVDLDPDIVLVTGDLITSEWSEQVEPAVELFKHLQPDRRAVFASPGNHEYGISCRKTGQASELASALGKVGIRMLRNEVTEYEGLQLVGLDDFMAGQFDAQTALQEFDGSRDGIALSHNPDTVDEPGWQGFGGWVLAGHTHGGQVRVPYYGAPITPVHDHRYTAGEIFLDDGRRLYVNRGLGYTRRVRFLCRPEITSFQLAAL